MDAPEPEPSDQLLESFLSIQSPSLVDSFNRLLDSIPSDSDQMDVAERAMRLGSALVEAAKEFARKQATLQISILWPLPIDLTVKIFSLLDTQSVCYAAVACSFFRKCAEDPLCYSNIDLVTGTPSYPRVNNQVVSQMTQRAGKALRSLKLAIEVLPGSSLNDNRHTYAKMLSCLSFLSMDRGALGSNLKRLHLHNIVMDNEKFDKALSSCPALLDLEIVNGMVDLRGKLKSVSKYCPLLRRLHLESPTSISKSGTLKCDKLELPICLDLVSSCPHLASLALIGFELRDSIFSLLFTGLRKLRYLDLSASSLITGMFLRNLEPNIGGELLEVLILRDCIDLTEMEVTKFVTAVIGGEFKLLRYLDITMSKCEAPECVVSGRCTDCTMSYTPPKQLFEARPGLKLLANFSPNYKRE